jgi:protoporphyrin/coproporphyrin ferrochelatase
VGDTAVLLIGFGGPTNPEEIRPFLDNVLRGRPVPPARYEEVVKQYMDVGGSSPYNAQTFELAEALGRELSAAGADLPVYVGMRNWRPFIADAFREMAEAGIKNVAGVVLTNFISEPSWDRYLAAVESARAELGPRAPEIAYASAWYKEPLFIQTVAERVAEALAPLPETRRREARWVFTAHSIPVPLDETSRYSRQLALSAKLVAKALGKPEWFTAYQSRSGHPEDAWLEPDAGDLIRSWKGTGVQDVLAVPIGFLSDHVEVLFDLDVKARRAAEEAGMNFLRAKTTGTHPAFVRLLAERARQTAARRKTASSS